MADQEIVIDEVETHKKFLAGDKEGIIADLKAFFEKYPDAEDESTAPAAEQAASEHQPEEKTDEGAGPVTPPTSTENLLRLVEIEQELLHMEV